MQIACFKKYLQEQLHKLWYLLSSKVRALVHGKNYLKSTLASVGTTMGTTMREIKTSIKNTSVVLQQLNIFKF